MPAKDFYHDVVVQAVIRDGWEITDDPFLISYGGRDLYVDLGAEKRAIAAQKGNQKIAIEIKSFLRQSPVRDLEESVGQYSVYQTYETIFTEKLGQLIVKSLQIKLLVFDEEQVRIMQWIP